MSSCREAFRTGLRVLAPLMLPWLAQAATPAPQADFPGIGRGATAQEIKAWDIDVRPDFKGLPTGSGSVAQGQDVWEARCASCHGIFGEANEVFTPLVGGTTGEDVKTGRVARLNDTTFPGRTTLMKVSTLSTLWDYINRAMPWNAPKSLSTDEVYSVTAYLLNMGGIVPDSFVLSPSTMAEAQQRLPNRLGVTTEHALWPGTNPRRTAQPDVKASACMKDCAPEAKVASSLPDFARNNHGNLALQQRPVGPQRGADTTRPPTARLGEMAMASQPDAAPRAAAKTPSAGATSLALAQKSGCTACHGVDNRIVGPAFREIAARYAQRSDGESYLVQKIRSGGQGTWGAIPMPPQTLPDGDLSALAKWLAHGASQ